MTWRKTTEVRRLECIRIALDSSAGCLPEELAKIKGAEVGLVYRVKRVAYENKQVKVLTRVGETSGLSAVFVGVDIENPIWYLERARAQFPNSNPTPILWWEVSPGLAIFDKLIKGTAPAYLDRVEGNHILCGTRDEYVRGEIWTREFIDPLKQLEDVMQNHNNLYEVIPRLSE